MAIKINQLSFPSYHRNLLSPLSTAESLGQYGTITLSTEIIFNSLCGDRMIGGSLDASQWLSIVPDVYVDFAVRALNDLQEFAYGLPWTTQTRHLIANQLSSILHTILEEHYEQNPSY
jgi:hypothetical protein